MTYLAGPTLTIRYPSGHTEALDLNDIGYTATHGWVATVATTETDTTVGWNQETA